MRTVLETRVTKLREQATSGLADDDKMGTARVGIALAHLDGTAKTKLARLNQA